MESDSSSATLSCDHKFNPTIAVRWTTSALTCDPVIVAHSIFNSFCDDNIFDLPMNVTSPGNPSFQVVTNLVWKNLGNHPSTGRHTEIRIISCERSLPIQGSLFLRPDELSMLKTNKICCYWSQEADFGAVVPIFWARSDDGCRPALRILHPKPSPSHQRQVNCRKCCTTAVLSEIHPLVQRISHRFDSPWIWSIWVITRCASSPRANTWP